MTGDMIVIAVLVAVVALAARSLWRARKSGCHCSGNCESCRGCGHSK